MALGVAVVSLLAIAPTLEAQTYPSSTDPRNGLKYGLHDAGEAIQGMRLVSATRKPAVLDSMMGLTFVNSDLAFRGNYVYQGNFAGFSIWEVKDMDEAVAWAKRSPQVMAGRSEMEIRPFYEAEDLGAFVSPEDAARDGDRGKLGVA